MYSGIDALEVPLLESALQVSGSICLARARMYWYIDICMHVLQGLGSILVRIDAAQQAGMLASLVERPVQVGIALPVDAARVCCIQLLVYAAVSY